MTLKCCPLHYTNEEIAAVAENPLPEHVAIIMDGNRRWAKKEFLNASRPYFAGHQAGAQVLTKIVEAASNLGIKVLTVFAFSTENWERSPEEVATLLQIIQTYLDNQRQKMVDEGVRFHVIGDVTPFSLRLKKIIEETIQATAHGTGIDFVVALNYGGRDEIRRVLQKVVKEVLAGTLSQEEMTEERLAQYLDTAPFGDPDLLIRTSGERRISNFLLWQSAYAEVYVTDTLWPDFTPRDLFLAVLDFQKRQRRIGK